MFSCLYTTARRTLSASEYFLQIKYYGRWSHRRPRRVLSSEQENSPEETSPIVDSEIKNDHYTKEKDVRIRWRHSAPQENIEDRGKNIFKKHKIKPNISSEVTYDMLETVIDTNGDLIYKKLPDKDVRITMLLTSLQANNKKEKKSVLLEGKRLIKEALQNNCKLEYLIFSRKDDIESLKSFLPKSGATLYKIPYREIQLWSDLTTCPGVMGIFKKPDITNFKPPIDSIPITVICDNIREPGNLGSILRTCAGVGCQNVILTKGCVNLWDSKVIRSSCGAHFQLQIHTQGDWSNIGEQLKSNSKIFLADNNVFNSQNQPVEETLYKIQSIPIIPYYGIYTDKTDPIVLIIGGETEGLSEEAYKLVYDFKGVRLNVPLSNGIDSLNSGVALGVILFEMKKQLLLNISDQREQVIQNV